MKIYVIQNSGVEHNELLGFYTDKKLAERDMDFIAKHDFYNGRTYQKRWVKYGKRYYEQNRSRYGNEKYPEWPSPRKAQRSGWIFGTMHVAEYNISGYPLQEVMDAVKAWQKRNDVHALTCGINSKHPLLVPKYMLYPMRGVGLVCKHKDCGWSQRPDHPVLALVHAAYIRNRPQAT